MDPLHLQELLTGVRAGEVDVTTALERLARLPVASANGARVDTHRALRCGQPEVVYGAGKTPDQLVSIAGRILDHHERLLVTRVAPEAARALGQAIPHARHDALARTVSVAPEEDGQGLVVVACAGTSDLPVAREATVTARVLGARVEELADIGVAGLHRLLEHEALLRRARAIVVAAGMEGALPSVVGGLVPCPVIAVPTSVGYGASFGGLAALLAMLNSCAAGVSVVNIDNGFGAGYSAAMINRMQEEARA